MWYWYEHGTDISLYLFVSSLISIVFWIQIFLLLQFSSVQFSHSVVSDSLHPVGCSMPGFPVHHQFSELAQTHVHQVGDIIQPSHPLLSPSPPVFNLAQHQGLFQWVSSSHQVPKVLELQLQHRSFQRIFRIVFLYNWPVWSPRTPRDSQNLL